MNTASCALTPRGVQSLDEFMVVLFADTTIRRQLLDEEILKVVSEAFPEEGETRSIAWVGWKRSHYNQGRLTGQREKPLLRCERWHEWPGGVRLRRACSYKEDMPRARVVFPKLNCITSRTQTGMVYCPIKQSHIAIMRCEQYQMRNNCGETCTMKALPSEIAYVHLLRDQG